jgi:hypothetical protein
VTSTRSSRGLMLTSVAVANGSSLVCSGGGVLPRRSWWLVVWVAPVGAGVGPETVHAALGTPSRGTRPPAEGRR